MVYCFNCKKQGHGFKYCKNELHVCTTCQTKGHHEDQCIFFNQCCYRCIEEGHININCRKHQRLKRCGAIILDQQQQILLVQGHSGVWSIPKGHQMHEKESYTSCAIREVYEETGLKLKITRNFKRIEIGKIVYFLIELNDYFKQFLKIRDKEEIKRIQWVSIQDIMKLNNINWSLKQVGLYFDSLLGNI